jgi:hypothetical protein
MAAPTVTVNIFPDGYDASGHRTRIHGYLTLSDDYQAGGDTFDPGQFGLAVLDSLVLGLGRHAGGTTIIFPVYVEAAAPLQASTTETPAGLIQAFTATGTEFSGDASGFVIPFVAFGV